MLAVKWPEDGTKQTFLNSLALILICRIFRYDMFHIMLGDNVAPSIMVLYIWIQVARLFAWICFIIATCMLLWRRKWDRIFLCLLLLFLPLHEGYEIARFYYLRPLMEKVAIETALEYQSADIDDTGVVTVQLPPLYWTLSRDHKIILAPEGENGEYEAYFLHYDLWPLTKTNQYIFDTGVSYTGPYTGSTWYPPLNPVLDDIGATEVQIIFPHWYHIEWKNSRLGE